MGQTPQKIKIPHFNAWTFTTSPGLKTASLENLTYTANRFRQPLAAVLTGGLPSASTPHRGRGSARSSATL